MEALSLGPDQSRVFLLGGLVCNRQNKAQVLKVEVRPIRSFDQGDARVKDYCSIAPGQSVDLTPPLTDPHKSLWLTVSSSTCWPAMRLGNVGLLSLGFEENVMLTEATLRVNEGKYLNAT